MRVISLRKGVGVFAVEVPLPEGAREATFQFEAAIDATHGDDCVLQVNVADREDLKTSNSRVMHFLADPKGPSAAKYREGILHFAQILPEVSQLPASPADRDAIPALFDNTYNRPERNFFHIRVKYGRERRVPYRAHA